MMKSARPERADGEPMHDLWGAAPLAIPVAELTKQIVFLEAHGNQHIPRERKRKQ